MEEATSDRPKGMVPLHGKPLLAWQIAAMRSQGIEEVGLVRGYRGSDLPFDVTYFENPRWEETNMVASLACAEDWLADGPVIVSYSDIVFEPNAAFKGDLARAYFYLATRYEDRIAGWQRNGASADAVLDGSSDQVFEDWFLDLLIDWHQNDPVSPKESARNDAAFDYQGNRNPFVDHPELVEQVWGN